jgi:hypothetical protein
VARFDWTNAKIPPWEAYANPLTIIRAFPERLVVLGRPLGPLAVIRRSARPA